MEKSSDFIKVTPVKTPLYSLLDSIQPLQLFPIKLRTFSALFEAEPCQSSVSWREEVQRAGSGSVRESKFWDTSSVKFLSPAGGEPAHLWGAVPLGDRNMENLFRLSGWFHS